MFFLVVLYEMSQILNCGLDQRTLTILAGLIENGVNPEALAAVVKELKRETEALKVSWFLLQDASSALNESHDIHYLYQAATGQ